MFCLRRYMYCGGVAASLLLLAGCVVGPESLGVSPQSWQRYSKVQRQKLIVGYHDVARLSQPGRVQSDGDMLQVALAHGAVMMPPFVKRCSYMPVIFTVPEGVCRSVVLRNSKLKKQVVMGVCYQNGILLLDPSRYDVNKRLGSIRFYKSPLWRRGFSYRSVHSTGFVRLQGATITIRIKDAAKTKRT